MNAVMEFARQHSSLLLFLGLAILAGIGLVHWWWSQSRTPVMVGRATVVSRWTEAGRHIKGKYTTNWNRLVRFRLTDGEELVLYAFESEMERLEEGSTGLLRWHGENFVDFLPDERSPL